MTTGTLYGIGVGPGDPDWLTVKAARLLATCRHVCVPRSRVAADSVALRIAQPHLSAGAAVHEITFPMTADREELASSWRSAAEQVRDILSGGQDCCFLTLGDAMLYSTWIYLVRELRAIAPQVNVVTVPGITAFSAAAAATNFAVGVGKQTVTLVPTPDDAAQLAAALRTGGTVVLMKVGKRLPAVIEQLERAGLLDRAVFVSHVGLPQQQIVTDLRTLRDAPPEAGYLSIVLVDSSWEAAR